MFLYLSKLIRLESLMLLGRGDYGFFGHVFSSPSHKGPVAVACRIVELSDCAQTEKLIRTTR